MNNNTNPTVQSSDAEIEKLKKRYKKQKIATIIALICSIVNCLALFQNKIHIPQGYSSIAIIIGLICYIFGGIRNLMSLANKLASAIYDLDLPFPANIILKAVCIFGAIIVALIIPFVGVLGSCLETRDILIDEEEI